MKIKLLLAFVTLTSIGFAQNQVNSFYGTNNSSFGLLSSVNPLNHTPSGINQTWTFGSLLAQGTSIYTYAAPTNSETTNYPGTTTVIVTNTTEGTTTTTAKTFTKNTANNTFSITGLTSADSSINFITNNATLGIFPMVYGYTFTDSNVAGNFISGTNSGTFTGTLVTSVDAYGTLNLPDFGFTASVTRLKTVLNISLSQGFFSNIGTVTQTSYSYYNPTDTSNNPAFRSVNTVTVIPLLSINQNNTALERYNGSQLAIGTEELETVWIKNPVQNSIEINSTNAIENATISVTDMLGKSIFETKNININGTFEIPISLTKGIYLISIATENGSVTKKIIKN